MAYIGKIPANAALTASDLADGIVSTDKLAADAVVTSKITDGTIAQADISNEAINEAKMQISNAPTNGYMLTAQSGNTGGLTWAAAGGGKIGQVLSATDETLRSTTSTSFVTASNTLSVDITPAATSSKIFITADFASGLSTDDQAAMFTIYRDSTNLGNAEGMVRQAAYNVGWDVYFPIGMNYLDSPSSTSQLTYQVRMKVNTGTSYINYGAGKCSITVMEVLA